jgi:hypothetical protein
MIKSVQLFQKDATYQVLVLYMLYHIYCSVLFTLNALLYTCIPIGKRFDTMKRKS